MITLDDLNEAIKECEGQRNPNANTALKLAAFYTIRNELYPAEPVPNGYSYQSEPTTVHYDSDTEFGKAIADKEPAAVMPIFDDLMSLLQSAQPRLYRRLLEKIQSV